MVQLLCEYSAVNIDAQLNSNGSTPLYLAAQEGHLECARYLLSKKANINIPTTDNYTPLFIAVNRGHVAMADLLLRYGASPDIKNLNGDNAYSLAYKDEIKKLLQKAKMTMQAKEQEHFFFT
jgi:ankyrin repeat protein